MTIFDIAKNMTPPDTSKALRPQANDTHTEERDGFRVTYVTQSQMDELSGSVGFLSFTQPSTGEMFIVEGLPKPIRDVALGIDRERMWAGITGPGLQGESVFDLIAELQRIERGPQIFPEPPDTRRIPRLPPVPSLPIPSVFGTPPLPGRVHGAAAAFTPSHPRVNDYLTGLGRATRKFR